MKIYQLSHFSAVIKHTAYCDVRLQYGRWNAFIALILIFVRIQHNLISCWIYPYRGYCHHCNCSGNYWLRLAYSFSKNNRSQLRIIQRTRYENCEPAAIWYHVARRDRYFGCYIWTSPVEREDSPDIKISEGRIYNWHRLNARQGKTSRAKCHCSRIGE